MTHLSPPVEACAPDGASNPPTVDLRSRSDRSASWRSIVGALLIGALGAGTAACTRSMIERATDGARVERVSTPGATALPRSSREPRPSTNTYAERWSHSDASRPVLGATQPPREAMSHCEVPLRESGYDVSIGFSVGIVFPGPQDLKFKRYGAGGAQTDYFFTNDVDTSTEHIETIDLTAWKRGGTLDRFGLRLEAVRWSARASANSFEDRLGSSVAAPPFRAVDEERYGVFASISRRWSLTRGGSAEDSPYGFLGLGLGEVHSAVSHGESLWDVGIQAYAGVAFPVSPSLRLRVAGTIYVTHDVDVPGTPQDWVVDTSGKRLFSHSTRDTRFYAATVGFEFRF